jgi:hypothetical protein
LIERTSLSVLVGLPQRASSLKEIGLAPERLETRVEENISKTPKETAGKKIGLSTKTVKPTAKESGL